MATRLRVGLSAKPLIYLLYTRQNYFFVYTKGFLRLDDTMYTHTRRSPIKLRVSLQSDDPREAQQERTIPLAEGRNKAGGDYR